MAEMTRRSSTEPHPFHASDEAFQFLFRTGSQPMWILDRSTFRFLDVNDAAIKTYGYTRAEFLHLTLEDILILDGNGFVNSLKTSNQTEDTRRCRHRTKDNSIVDVEVTWRTLHLNDVAAKLVIVRDLRYQQPSGMFYDSVELQQVLIRMATRFVNVPVAQLDESINDALGTIGAFIHADRVYVFKYDYDVQTMSNTHEWCREGVSREIENSQDIPFDVLPDAVAAHRRGDIFSVPNVGVLPEGPFRAILEAQQIKSLILIPMIFSGTLLGFVGFDAVYQVRDFSNTEIMLLKVLAETLVNAEVRRTSHESLRKSEEKFRTLVETTSDFIWETDANGVYTYVSPRIEVMLGYSQEEILGKTPFDLMPPEEAQRVRALFRTSVAAKKPFNGLENVNLHKDGHRVVLETSGIPIIDTEGHLRGYRGSDRDITARKKAEAQLIANEQRYRTLFDLSPAGITLLDSAAKIIEANDAFFRSHQHTKADLLGKSVSVLVPRTEHESVQGHLDRILAGETLEHEVENIRRDGSTCIIELRETRIPLPNGEMGVLSVANDITERKRAEAALRESEQKFRTVVQNADAIIFILDNSGVFLLSEGRGLAKLGLKPGEVVGLSALELYKDYEEILLSIRHALEGRQAHSTSYLNNAVFTTVYSPYYDTSGRLNGVVGVATDVTSQKEAEEKLRRSEELYRLLAENSTDVIWLMNLEGRFLYVSPSVKSLLGYTPEEVINFRFEELMTFDSTRVAHGYFYDAQDAILNGQTLPMRSFEVELLCRNGGTKWAEITAGIVYDDEGKFKSIIGSAHSISDRKRTEDALRISEEKYRRFFEEDLTGIFISTPEGRFLDCNPAFIRIFGFSSLDDALQCGAGVLYNSAEQRQEMLNVLCRDRKLLNVELSLRKKDGTPVHVLENIIGTFDEHGNLSQLMGYVFDKSVQKHLEHQLLQSQKMESLGTLASGIAHDFNNILGIVLGHASLLGTSPSMPPQDGRHVDSILRATERGIGVVKQLLTFARKTEVLLESVRINDVITELARLLHETFPKSIHVDTNLRSSLPSILADTNQMHQVLLNLCVNSRDAMPTGGTITISADIVPGETMRQQWPDAAAHEYVVVSVADTGVGMEDETRERIFEPFFTTKERGKGTGLGLAIVYGVVQAHKGHIDVQSQQGEGTTFTLYFPALVQAEARENDTSAAPYSVRGTETILFVEDEPMLMDLVTEFLSSNGYKVMTAADGITAAEIYARHRGDIALVISDLGLPRLGGDELFLMLKSLNPAVRFILASGFVDPSVKARLSREGLQHMVNKPYHPLHVVQKIREVIDTE